MPSYLLRNLALIAPLALVQLLAYLWLNHHPRLPPTELPLLWVDRAIPFWPWTAAPYLAMNAGQLLLALAIRRADVLRLALAAYLPAMAIALFVHWWWPTAYPRPEAASDVVLARLYDWLVQVDNPTSAFPSAHIVGPLVVCWGVSMDRKCWRPWLVVYLALGAPTILTTKQHYVWDLLGGAGIALGCMAVAWGFGRLAALTPPVSARATDDP